MALANNFKRIFNKSPLDCLAASGVDIDDLLLAQVQLAVAAKNNIAGAAIADELLQHAQTTLNIHWPSRILPKSTPLIPLILFNVILQDCPLTWTQSNKLATCWRKQPVTVPIIIPILTATTPVLGAIGGTKEKRPVDSSALHRYDGFLSFAIQGGKRP